MESASLLSRESTTLSFSKPQKGHFMTLGTAAIVAGESSTADWEPYAGPQPQHSKVLWNCRFGTAPSGGSGGRRCAGLLCELALCRQHTERQSFAMRQHQSQTYHSNTRIQQQLNSVACGHLLGIVEEIL